MARPYAAVILVLFFTQAPVHCQDAGPPAAPRTTGAESRTWNDATGQFQIEAQFVDYGDGKVILKRANGSRLEVELEKLSRSDQAFVRGLLRRRRTPLKRNPPPANDPQPADDPADGNFERGLGILPLATPRPYVHVEADRLPAPEAGVRCRWADPQQDPNLLVEQEKRRLVETGRKHAEWERKLNSPLVRVDTHQMVVHAQLPVVEARKVGMALEAMKLHLQKMTGSMWLTQLKPERDELVIVFGKPQYLRLLKVIEADFPDVLGQDWHLAPMATGGSIGRLSYFYHANNPFSAPPAHMAVSQAASRSILEACGYQAPDWLIQGFSAYCENVVLQKNLIHAISYENNNLRLDSNWAVAVRNLAAARQLQPWNELVQTELRNFQPVHYVQSYAMVSYLIQSDPQKFMDLTEKVSAGVESGTALEQVYGLPPVKLQGPWLQWILRG